ncbi:MAG: rhodanese-like domain-containing protein [Pseudomonadota bacterium]
MDEPIQNVAPRDAFARLELDAEAQLIDVRTPAEWTFSGHPDLAPLGKFVIFAQWSSFPEQIVDPGFADQLSDTLAERGVAKDAPLFFICRSGVRSLAAADAMAAKGYTRCFNVADGFEGPLDGDRHRGHVAGWKASELPWVQV